MPEASPSSRPRVLYICGWGRSGSTIADRVLGTLSGFFSAGEVRSLWDYDPFRHHCSCGATVSACPIWGPTLVNVLGVLSPTSFATVRAGRDRTTQSRHLPKLIRARHHLRPSDSDAEYGTLLAGLYASLLKQSGEEVVVDSSKHPAEALLLAARPDIDLTVLHLVRDPRAVAYSWKRRHHDAQIVGDRPPCRGVASSTAWWDMWNGVAEVWLQKRLGDRYIRLRYEDLMADPRSQFEALARRLGGSPESLPFTDATTVSIGPQHTVAGNPARVGAGSVALTLDQEWVHRMSTSDRVLSSGLAFPLLLHYGYRSAEGSLSVVPTLARPAQTSYRALTNVSRMADRQRWRRRPVIGAPAASLPDGTLRVYHHHVRKTGGTSLNRAFLSLGGEDPGTVHSRMRGTLHVADSQGLRFVAHDRQLLREGRYFYGWDHTPAWSIELPSATFTVTVLRDPAARLLSLYRYLADARPDANEPFKAGRLERRTAARGFGRFLDQVRRSDSLNQLYMFSKSYSVSEAADRIRSCSAWFMTEQYDTGLLSLGSALGLKLPCRWDRRSVGTDEVVAQHRDRLAELLEPEYALLRALYDEPGHRLAAPAASA